MGEPIDQKILLQAVHRYAESLRAALDCGIGLITVGAPLTDRNAYRDANLLPHNPKEELHRDRRKQHEESDVRSEKRRGPIAPPVPVAEADVLRDWRKQSYRSPMLVVAPVGAGKSAFLESVAYRMVQALVKDAGRSNSQRSGSFVPLLLPLAKLQGDSLEGYLLRAEEEVTGRPPCLSPDAIRQLRDTERLVLLIDGFDEVPGDREGLIREMQQLHCPFVLTSRPGHGAEAVIGDSDCHRTLAELGSHQMRDYVRAFFVSFKCADLTPDEAVTALNAARCGPVGWLLGRPLYLKVWCEYVRDNPTHAPPDSLCDLAERLLLAFVRSRAAPAEAERRSAVRPELHIAKLRHWLGKLGYYFAERGFTPQKLDDAVGRKLLADAEPDGLLEWALRSGLLVKILGRHYLPRIPVVEYCVGKFLAEDATDNPKGPKFLIDTFRRWIWRPTLHDLLDYTFDALWHSSDVSVRQWADDLLTWAVDVGRHDVTRNPSEQQPTQDDLLHPFALSAMRWHALHSSMWRSATGSIRTQALEAASDVPKALATARAPKGDMLMAQRVFGSLQTSPLVRPLIEGLVEQQRASGSEIRDSFWLTCIQVASSRLDHRQAPELLFRWAANFESATIKGAMGGWEYAAVGAAGRLSEEEVTSLMEVFAARAAAATKGGELRILWAGVMEEATKQISEPAASGLLRTWLQRALSTDGWWYGVWGVAERVDEVEAAGLMHELLTTYLRGAAQEAKWDVLTVIDRVAHRVSATDARKLVKTWIGQASAANIDLEHWAWKSGVRAASDRLGGEEAVEMTAGLFSEQSAANDHELWKAWYQPGKWAVDFSRKRDAVKMVEELVARQSATTAEEPDRREFDWAIEHAAEHVNELQAGGVVQRWINNFAASCGNVVNPAWVLAVIGAACRVRSDEVLSLVEQVAAIRSNPRFADISEHCVRAMKALSGRAAGPDALTLCNWLLKHGFVDVAFASIVDSNVAIVSNAGEASAGQAEPAYTSILREPSGEESDRLILDPLLSVAPDRLKTALIDTTSELEHDDALALLIHLNDVAQKQKRAEDQWVARKILFAAAGVTQQRGRQGWLLDLLLRRRFIETMTIPNAGKKPPTVKCRITSTGHRFLENRHGKN